jgi:hypothetical protein
MSSWEVDPELNNYPPEDLSGWIKTEMEGTPDPDCSFCSAQTHTRTHPMTVQKNRIRKKKE